MRFRGFRTRSLLIIVAIIAILIGIRVELDHRSSYFDRRNLALSVKAYQHYRSGEPVVAHWYATRARKYRELRDRPWTLGEPKPEKVSCDCPMCASSIVNDRDGELKVSPR